MPFTYEYLFKLNASVGDNSQWQHPYRVHKGAVYLRQYMATSHKEAEQITAQQAIMCPKQQPGAVSVDTDVFVLLLHH